MAPRRNCNVRTRLMIPARRAPRHHRLRVARARSAASKRRRANTEKAGVGYLRGAGGILQESTKMEPIFVYAKPCFSRMCLFGFDSRLLRGAVVLQ